MIEQIWNAILQFTAQFVIPDWGSVIALLPVLMALLVIAFFVRVAVAYATAGPKRVRVPRRGPVPPEGVHMPGPSFAPFFAAVGTFLLFFGLVFGGPSILLGLVALLLTLLYWGREALTEYDHLADTHPQLPAVIEKGAPPGVHIPGPSFRPILASLADPVRGSRLRRLDPRSRRVGHDPDAARLAERRPEGVPPRRRCRPDGASGQ
jgi:hypothetical protein